MSSGINNRALVATGAVGAMLAVVCCTAPFLVPTVAALGFAAAAVWSGRALIAVIVGLALVAGYCIHLRPRLAAIAAHYEGTEPDDC